MSPRITGMLKVRLRTKKAISGTPSSRNKATLSRKNQRNSRVATSRKPGGGSLPGFGQSA